MFLQEDHAAIVRILVEHAGSSECAHAGSDTDLAIDLDSHRSLLTT
jgi:hypothetical protein